MEQVALDGLLKQTTCIQESECANCFSFHLYGPSLLRTVVRAGRYDDSAIYVQGLGNVIEQCEETCTVYATRLNMLVVHSSQSLMVLRAAYCHE
jgi:hypothetical protein